MTHSRLFLLALLLTCSTGAFAQLNIKANSVVHARGLVVTNGPITNSSLSVNFEEAELLLAGSDQQISTVQAFTVNTLSVEEGGTKTLLGAWIVTNTLNLTSGIIKIGPGAELLYSGSGKPEGSDASFVDGYLYRNTGGQLFFPIGTGNTYAPAVIESAAPGKHGIRVVAPAGVQTMPINVISNFEGYYWELTEAPVSPVSLSLNGVREFLGGGAPVVLQSDSPNGVASSLSGATSAEFVTSIQDVTASILTVGKTPEFNLIIHDVITPFDEATNNRLTIENIELVSGNTVRLLDRWGVIAAEWTNYSDDTDFDFTNLSPGNYICIVDYIYPGETRTVTTKGIVTILKSK